MTFEIVASMEQFITKKIHDPSTPLSPRLPSGQTGSEMNGRPAIQSQDEGTAEGREA